jgi:hypothetical protein
LLPRTCWLQIGAIYIHQSSFFLIAFHSVLLVVLTVSVLVSIMCSIA